MQSIEFPAPTAVFFEEAERNDARIRDELDHLRQHLRSIRSTVSETRTLLAEADTILSLIAKPAR